MSTEKYFEFVSRNSGYIQDPVQRIIRDSHVLIAGCGIGSQVAMALARMGFSHFTLIDGDEVSLTNLNRQSFYFDQIGEKKSSALAKNMKRINPDIQIRVCDYHFDSKHAPLFKGVDLIMDTIDFLDLNAILDLHEAAENLQIPLLSGMSVGWGSCGIFFPNAGGRPRQFRKIFGIETNDQSSKHSYVEKFAQLFERIKEFIDPQVVSVMRDTFTKLANNQPCPAPQVVGGSYNLASLMSALCFQYLNGDKIPESPHLIISDLNRVIKYSLFDLRQ